MKKRYKITYDMWWEMHVVIDHAHPGVDSTIKASAMFWSGSEERLEHYDGDYIKTFLHYLFERVIQKTGGAGWVRQEMKQEEGFPPLDGSYGIYLEFCDTWEFTDPDSIEVEDVAEAPQT